jgi:pimeloyl-ACP methyl ester carboxylesterase
MTLLRWLLMTGSAGIAISLAARVPARGSDIPTSPDPTILPYASTASSVRLADGRFIHLVCAGQGTPIVILTAARGSWAVDWNRVQPALAKKTRVCAWDRAGFGLSDSSPVPQTVDNTTSDLEAALIASQISGPYVLVGHSMGSYETLLMADRHPADVLGMVLVDPSIPDQTAVFRRVAPARDAYFRQEEKVFLDDLGSCAAGITSGTLRLGEPRPSGCPMPFPPSPTAPEAVRRALDQQFHRSGASRFTTVVSYLGSAEQDGRIVVNTQRTYGSKPIIVLRAADLPKETDLPIAVMSELSAQMEALREGHAAYKRLSSTGELISVSNTGHFIQQDRPEIVINAVSRVIDRIRSR